MELARRQTVVDFGVVTFTNQQNSILPYLINDLLMWRSLKLPETDIEDYPVSIGQAAALLSPEDAKLKIDAEAPPSLDP